MHDCQTSFTIRERGLTEGFVVNVASYSSGRVMDMLKLSYCENISNSKNSLA